MTTSVPGILARIVEEKRLELQQATISRDALERRAADLIHQRRDFIGSLRARKIPIISEIKKASPSKGLFSTDFHPAAIAKDYEAGGAAAISVLTDRKFFQGSLEDLETVRAAVSLPVLRKDFTTDEYHVVEAAAHGADAILLIAAVLSDDRMRALRELAAEFKMAALVEVHDAEELNSAIASGAEMIGVNNRNLHTFEVTLDTSLELADKIPDSAFKVSESGFDSRHDIDRLLAAGYNAFLIGEHLMKASVPREALLALTA